jgi:hypothetical protein
MSNQVQATLASGFRLSMIAVFTGSHVFFLSAKFSISISVSISRQF